MRHLITVGVVAAILGISGCGGDNGGPTSPTSPTLPTFTLSGTVTDGGTGAGISTANVRIDDGPNAGRSVTTDGSGRYSLSGLQQSGFTATASRQYYVSLSKGVGLTSNQSVDFALTSIPVWTKTGSGNSVFDMPTYISRVRIYGRWSGRGTSNFIVLIGGRLVVNAILRDNNPYQGVHLTSGGVVAIEDSENIVEWSFTEER